MSICKPAVRWRHSSGATKHRKRPFTPLFLSPLILLELDFHSSFLRSRPPQPSEGVWDSYSSRAHFVVVKNASVCRLFMKPLYTEGRNVEGTQHILSPWPLSPPSHCVKASSICRANDTITASQLTIIQRELVSRWLMSALNRNALQRPGT